MCIQAGYTWRPDRRSRLSSTPPRENPLRYGANGKAAPCDGKWHLRLSPCVFGAVQNRTRITIDSDREPPIESGWEVPGGVRRPPRAPRENWIRTLVVELLRVIANGEAVRR